MRGGGRGGGQAADQFYRNKHTTDRLESQCKTCKRSALQNVPLPVVDQKRCTKCGQVKQASHFDRYKRTADGLQSQCKDCMKVRSGAAVPLREVCVFFCSCAPPRRRWHAWVCGIELLPSSQTAPCALPDRVHVAQIFQKSCSRSRRRARRWGGGGSLAGGGRRRRRGRW